VRVLISGPPAAGKSTLAQSIAAEVGGEVIDFDAIAAELGSTGHAHDKAVSERAHAEVARRMREIQGPAVLVKTAPERADRERFASEFGADLVYMVATSADLAKSRAVHAARPGWTADAIDKWWSRYEPSDNDALLGDSIDFPAVLAGLRTREAVNSRSLEGEPVSEAAGTGTAEGSTETVSQDGNTGGTTSTASNEWKPPATQDELNRIIADRIARVEGKYKDAPEARKKAAEYDKLVEAQKTELQKIQERAEAAEKRAADLEAAEAKRQADADAAKQIADWKTKIANEAAFEGVPASALRGSTEEELREHAKELKELIPERKGGAYVPAEGRNAGSGGSDPRQQFAEILKRA
jgi:predicted kinase